jgi:hypothetical protein
MAVIPEIERVTWMDMYRDGGSLSISFEGLVGDQYCLFFKVEKDRDFMTIGYNLPRLTAYYPHEWKSKFTGKVHGESTKKIIFISWEDTIYMLDCMKDMIDEIQFDPIGKRLSDDLKKRHHSMYQDICQIAKKKGRVS